MVLTPSLMAQLGTEAPDFRLTDVKTGKGVTRDSAKGPKGLLVMFVCRHCPFVKHVERELARIGKDYAMSGVGIVAISSNDPATQPDDAPQSLKQQAEALDFYFPYLYDETQQVAKDVRRALHAGLSSSTTRACAWCYRGQLDDSRPEERRARGLARPAARARRRGRGATGSTASSRSPASAATSSGSRERSGA
jgi:peroxiredoxin